MSRALEDYLGLHRNCNPSALELIQRFGLREGGRGQLRVSGSVPPWGPNNFCRLSARKINIAPERACKPGPVSRGMPGETVISLGRRLPGASSGHTREHHAGRASPGLADRIALLLGLAPGGVYRAGAVTRVAGELLPHRFTLTVRYRAAVCFLWHWSVGLPPLAVSQHPALRSPDFPPARVAPHRRPSSLLWRESKIKIKERGEVIGV